MSEKNVIINIGRQVCAGGLEIGKLLAQEFNAKYYDRELLNLAARESGFSEAFIKRSDEKKGFFSSLIHLRGTNAVSGENFYQNDFSQESLFKFQSDAIIKAARQSSCVFVGRCADYVLRDFPNVFNIFITAPLESRAELFMKEKNVTHDEAIKRIEHIESRRASYYNYYTGKKWGYAASYDLCVDASLIGAEATAKVIAEVIHKRFEL